MNEIEESNLYNQIEEHLSNKEITFRVKDYSKNKYELNTYYEIGRLLSEAGKCYGEKIIKKYSVMLQKRLDKKYNTTTLKRIRQFYWLIEKGAPLAHQLTWSHYTELIPLKNINKINYYINRILINNLSKRQLREIIKSNEYERLPEETKSKLVDNINNNHLDVRDFIKNPILIRNANKVEVISEKVLQNLIHEDISGFMEELGPNFAYIGKEYKIKIENRYNYIDILLYNIKYKCYVVVELKVTEAKKEHIGQIEVYMNYIDKYLKTIEEDKTIGIIIVRKDNINYIEYCSNPKILVREFELET